MGNAVYDEINRLLKFAKLTGLNGGLNRWKVVHLHLRLIAHVRIKTRLFLFFFCFFFCHKEVIHLRYFISVPKGLKMKQFKAEETGGGNEQGSLCKEHLSK